MCQVLGLSSFYFIIWVFPALVFAQKSGVVIKPQKQVQAISIPDTSFLSQAEDIEREAWWVITNERRDGAASPFRVLRAASAQIQKKQKTKISFRFCKNLLIIQQDPSTWRVESACQKPSVEIGVLQKLSNHPNKWKISWKTGPFSDHFGLSTSVLYNQQSCEIEVSPANRIARMSCPHYVRDRRVGEIAEFVIFEYQAQAPAILKIEGDVKKDLHPIATFKTEVPMSGDIIVKIKKIPQKTNPEVDAKPVANKTEFSNMSGSVPTQGDSNGQNPISSENQSEKQEIKNHNYEENSQNYQNQIGGEQDEIRPSEVPPISAPPSR